MSHLNGHKHDPKSDQNASAGYADKIANAADRYQAKLNEHKPHKKDESGPAGGYDNTPVPRAPPGFTVKITFHRATSLPMADIQSLSSDPFILAQLNTNLIPRHKQDPHMRFRTPTIRRSTNPVWDCEWIVANVPASGFKLKARIYDEDPADHDDRLGNVHVHVDRITEDWQGIKEQAFKIKKRSGSKRAYAIRGCAAMLSRQINFSGDLVMSVEVLGRTEAEHGGHIYTVGPCAWSQHVSPLIGRLTGTKNPSKDGSAEKYNFQANQIQLEGPVPPSLYHRYVEFKPFIAGMFNSTSLKGRILHRALHHQHSRIYNYDRSTVYGSFPRPSQDMVVRFLDLVHWDKGGRIYTYIITLDGQWRFTETGKEFGIDLLSKHTMHSDVCIYIAFSGEFFIRRLKDPKSSNLLDQETHPPAEIEGGPPNDDPPRDPAHYALVIDNDSGTYRPNAELLPELKKYLHHNLPGMHITTLDCNSDKDRMNKMKAAQRERRKAEGKHIAYMQDNGSSISSSDEEDLEERVHGFDQDKKDPTDEQGESSRVRQVMHLASEPKQKGMQRVEGDRGRGKREAEDDMAPTKVK